MTNHKVNLPKTSFPMKADLPKREPKVLEFWQSIDLYKSFAKPKDQRGKFIVHDGPPYANGDIHLGHAFNKILKDTINKTKLLEGYSVPYVPGWDCHGLPIELNVEKKFGKAGVGITVEKFIAECRKYAAEQIQIQMKDFQRLGVVGDWNNYYSTMDFKYEADIVRALMNIIDAKFVTRGYKSVHWCMACGSALAEAEVEYKDKVSSAIDVRFKLVKPNKFKAENINIPIWTTTPWTLLANEAVCVNSKLKYVLVECKTLGEHLIVLEDLLANVMQRYGESNYNIQQTFNGSELSGLEVQHPFLANKVVPVILGEHVTADAGTGAVHTAPGHGQEDYKIGMHYKLPITNPVGGDGKFLPSTTFFAGLNVFAANDKVIDLLKERGNLIHVGTLQHSYPHCWRHKTPLIFRATEQWFVSMDTPDADKFTLRDIALDAIEKVTWLPSQGKNSMRSMLEQRPDWCISRQRFWGIPMTLFVHKETGAIHPEMSRLINEIIAPNIEKKGLTYWQEVEATSFLEEHTKTADAINFNKVTDTLDVWFNSGVSHYCVLEKRDELYSPADLYIEGSDQYRGWFQSSLLTAMAMRGEAPYKAVITHGFCVDGKGHKMSKSLGNVISPRQVVDKYGADVLRLWVASTYLHDDLAASEEIFARTVDIYRTLRNTARFLLGNLFDFNPIEDALPATKMLPLDRWAVAQVLDLARAGRELYNTYQLHVICSDLQVTLTTDISSFYFSIIKDRLYTMHPSSVGRRSAQTALFHMLEVIVRLIAPILSFTAEEIWQEMIQLEKKHAVLQRKESVFMARWDEIIGPENFDIAEDNININDWSQIEVIRSGVNKELEKLRLDGVIGSNLDAVVSLYCGTKSLELLSKLEGELRFIFITSDAHVYPINRAPSDAVSTAISGVKLQVLASPYKKCSRCWHHRQDVGANGDHPELCDRCVSNLFGSGEVRSFA